MMESLKILFPVSGVETYFFVPPLLAFVISFFSSFAGLSGAFLLLPVNMSLLGFTSVAVTSTNFLYNVIGIPGGVARFIRERRMVWPLALAMTAGTLPGVVIGYWLRMRFFPDPRVFKLFVGVVLLFMSWRLLAGLLAKKRVAPALMLIEHLRWDLRTISYTFAGREIVVPVSLLVLFSFLVGIVGGIYGIGGGALYVPFCVGVLGIPIHTLAGASLFGTFVTSIAGCLIYSTLPVAGGQTAPPDWPLGILYGLGGLAGMYSGARFQKHIPEHLITAALGLLLIYLAIGYIVQFFG
ncbi:MAG: sulfite exporter TauE/SafE family protein [Thermodesulfobacteriota bacterium]